METNIDWTYYRSFLGVLQEGSLSGAARELGLTQPTIGRHIAALEAALGLVLFTRSQAGLLPTEVALAMRTHAQEMASTAAALERVAASQGDGVRGVVRVTASEVIGVEVLPPIVAALSDQYPDLQVELILTNRVQDLLHRDADIAVRMLRPQQEQLVAQHIGEVELGLHATADYIARHGSPETTEALLRHTLIGFDQPSAFIRRAMQEFPPIQRAHFSLRTDSDLGQLALIRAGAGIGFCQALLAKRNPPLVRILHREFSLKLDTWITMHEDLRHSPRCRATFDALVRGLRQYIAGEL